jgi:hypothetical protein
MMHAIVDSMMTMAGSLSDEALRYFYVMFASAGAGALTAAAIPAAATLAVLLRRPTPGARFSSGATSPHPTGRRSPSSLRRPPDVAAGAGDAAPAISAPRRAA